MNIALVSKKVSNLKEYLESNGTFHISYPFESIDLLVNFAERNLIHIDKLVIIVRSDRELMYSIRSILKLIEIPNSFFKTEEIGIIFKTDEVHREEVDKVIPILQKHIEDKKSKIKVLYYELKRLEYDLIANSVLGQTEPLELGASTYYRFLQERNSDSKMAFSAEKVDGYYTPKDVSRKQSFENTNKLLESSEKSTYSQDLTVIEEFQEVEDLDIDYYELQPMTNLTAYICSGHEGSGTTTHSLALASSFQTLNQNIIILDISKSHQASEVVLDKQLPMDVIKNEEFLFSKSLDKTTLFYNTEYEGRFEYLLSVINHILVHIKNIDTLIVNCDLTDLEMVDAAMAFTNHAIVFSAYVRRNELLKVSQDIRKWDLPVIWLNSEGQELTDEQQNLVDEALLDFNSVSQNVTVIAPIYFDNFDVSEDLALLIGGI